MSARNDRIGRRCLLPLVLALAILMLTQTAPAQLAPGAQAPANRVVTAPGPVPTSPYAPGPVPGSPSAPAAGLPLDPNAGVPQVAVNPGWGLCQCISAANDNTLGFTCPGSAQACQSTCGTNYSFKPDAACRRPPINQ